MFVTPPRAYTRKSISNCEYSETVSTVKFEKALGLSAF